MSVQLGVFCGSNTGNSPVFVEQARRLGSAIGRRGLGLVYGGGRVGLMGAVADAALEHGSEVTGVITDQLVGAEVAHPGLTTLEIVPTMHDRKARMADLASGFVTLPGGFGTLDETLEILTWNQLGLMAKPVAFLDVEGYYAGLFDFLDQAVEAQFVRGAHRMLAQRARTVDEAVAIATGPAPETPHKWIDRDGA
ncbi:MAG: TIGR00730 family Rossman fold protein [Ilumatobacteraceae bacterium]